MERAYCVAAVVLYLDYHKYKAWRVMCDTVAQ